VQFAAQRRGRFSSERYRRPPQIAVVHRNAVIAGVVCPERRRRKIKARSIRGRRQRQPTTAGALFVNAKPAILLLCCSVTSSMRIEGNDRFAIITVDTSRSKIERQHVGRNLDTHTMAELHVPVDWLLVATVIGRINLKGRECRPSSRSRLVRRVNANCARESYE